jgi:hypothetical protein
LWSSAAVLASNSTQFAFPEKCEPLNGVMNVLYGNFGSKVNLVN